jgi:hemoglobin-like flavoprotein
MGLTASKDTSAAVPGPTPEQKDAIRASWKVIEQHRKDIGVSFFLQLFAKYPDYQQVFVRMKNVSPEDLPTHKALLAHALTFMRGMDAIVDSLDDLGCIDELLYKIATKHQPFGLKEADLKNATDLFADSLHPNEALEGLDFSTEFIADSWRSAFDVTLPIVGKYMEELE